MLDSLIEMNKRWKANKKTGMLNKTGETIS